MMVADVELDKDSTLSLYAHEDDLTKVAAALVRIATPADTYTDEKGTVWTPPTAWAYAKACNLRDYWRDRALKAEEALS